LQYKTGTNLSSEFGGINRTLSPHDMQNRGY
jgi:hypothetical protein